MTSLYNPAVPTGIIELDEDYINLQNNFQQLDTTYKVNHVALTDGTTNNGAHTFVEMRNQAGLPAGLKTLEGTIYTKQASGISELFYTPDITSDQYQLTSTYTTEFAKFGTNTAYVANHTGGWTFLPGGLLMQYGSRTSVVAGVQTITFPRPFLTQVYSITLSFNRTEPSSVIQMVRLSNFNPATLASFKIYSGSANNEPTMWMAIGK